MSGGKLEALLGGPRLTSNSRFLRLLQANNKNVNNGTTTGGLAHALTLAMKGYLVGADFKEEAAGQEALAAGTQAMLGTPDGEINWNTARPDGSGDMTTKAPGVAPDMSRAAQLLAANPRTAHLGKNIAMQQHAQRQAATTEAAKYKRTRADQLTDASTSHERQVGIKQLPMSPEQLQQQKDINQSKVSPKANWLGVPGIGAFNVSNREMISPYGNSGGQPGQTIPASAGPSVPGSPLTIPPGISGKGREGIISDSIKAGRASMSELQKSISTAQKMANQARTFKQLMSTQETGGFLLNLPGAEKVSNIIGDKELPNMYAISNFLTPLMRQGLPGAASDRDVAMFRGATLDPSKPSEANNLIADGLIVAAQNKEGELAFKTAYMKQYTTLDGADAAWNKYLNDNPIFEPDPATGKPGLNKNRASWNDYFSGNQTPQAPVTQASGQEPSVGGNVKTSREQHLDRKYRLE